MTDLEIAKKLVFEARLMTRAADAASLNDIATILRNIHMINDSKSIADCVSDLVDEYKEFEAKLESLYAEIIELKAMRQLTLPNGTVLDVKYGVIITSKGLPIKIAVRIE